jgi:hypothetical protein
MPVKNENFVYLYKDLSGRPKYVGYGHSVQRALSHSGASHNKELKDWLARDQFDLLIAGPYRSESEAKAVEAALISSMNPSFNLAPGDGPKFLPVGVPPELWERPQLKALSLSEIGRQTGGALLVYLAAGDFLRDGRKKFDAALPTDADAVSNIEKNWDIASLIEQWSKRPASAPKVLIGIHGKVKHRFIVGALEIDRDRLNDPDFIRHAERWARPRRQVPLIDSTNLDMNEIRGRRVDGIKFGQFSHQLHIWVDGRGRQRHPIPKTEN